MYNIYLLFNFGSIISENYTASFCAFLVSIMLGGCVHTPHTIPENDTITPHKFTDEEQKNGFPRYKIPDSARFSVKRHEQNAPDIIYYLTKPTENSYPIVITCGGSSDKNSITSIIHVHRYFLKEFLDLGIGVVSVEQQGVDGNKINSTEFMNHYTRSNRLLDHKCVIAHLQLNPPTGWNGKLIFLGVSEGGPIVTALTENYQNVTLATMNWAGAGDWSWREELWAFIKHIRPHILLDQSMCPHSIPLNTCQACLDGLNYRKRYDTCMDKALQNPTAEEYFLNMTYKYHADAMTFPKQNYAKIHTPFLVVTGDLDPLIKSSDQFVQKEKKSGGDITYLRIKNMDHYVRKRLDVVSQSFEWLKTQLVK